MYDPSVGRWLSVDPLGFDAEDINLYRYVGNSPATLIDASGLQESSSCLSPHFADEFRAWARLASLAADGQSGDWQFEVKRSEIKDPLKIKALGNYPMAFSLTYRPTDKMLKFLNTPIWINGEKPQLILSHAVNLPGYPSRFDGKYKPPGECEFPYFPEYSGILQHGGLTVVDAPVAPGAGVAVSSISSVTTCAVIDMPDPACPGKRNQYVLGCANYDWDHTNKTVIMNGTTLKNGDGKSNWIPSANPGAPWEEAIPNEGRL